MTQITGKQSLYQDGQARCLGPFTPRALAIHAIGKTMGLRFCVKPTINLYICISTALTSTMSPCAPSPQSLLSELTS